MKIIRKPQVMLSQKEKDTLWDIESLIANFLASEDDDGTLFDSIVPEEKQHMDNFDDILDLINILLNLPTDKEED